MLKINLKRIFTVGLIIEAIFLASLFIPFHYVTDELKDYYDSYMLIINGNCHPSQYVNPHQFYMTFDNLSSEGLAGVTYSSNTIIPRRLIWIDNSEWGIYTKDQKISLVFHELTHAYFNYPDLSGYNNRKHFMYESMNNLSTTFETYQQLNDLTKDLCKSP